MIAIYLLDDPNYSREDAARGLINIINDLDSVAACISLDSDEKGVSQIDTLDEAQHTHAAAASAERDGYPLTLTVNHISEILHLERHKVYEVCRSKGFPRLKGVGHIRVPRDSFFKWLDNKTV